MGRPTTKLDPNFMGLCDAWNKFTAATERVRDNLEERFPGSRAAGDKFMKELAEQICSVQPMNVDLSSLFNGPTYTDKELKDAGYRPVSGHKILWVKDETGRQKQDSKKSN